MMEHYVEVRNQELMEQLLRGNCVRHHLYIEISEFSQINRRILAGESRKIGYLVDGGKVYGKE